MRRLPVAAAPLLVCVLSGPGCATKQHPAPIPDVSSHLLEFGARMPAPASNVGSGFDLSDGVSPAEAEAVALVFNADLRLERLAAGIAAADSEQAGRWDDPVLGIDFSRLVGSVSRPWTTAATLALTIPLSGRLSSDRAAAEAANREAMLRVELAEWRVRIDVRRAFAELDAARGAADAARESLDALRGLADDADRLVAAGELARIDGRVVRAETGALALALGSAEARVAASEIAIRSMMGLSPGAPVSFTAGGRPSPRSHGDAAVALSPRVRAARAAHEASVAALRHEEALATPDLGLAPSVGSDRTEPERGVGLSLPLPIFRGNRRAAAAAAARCDLAFAAVGAAAEAVAAELAVATLRWRAAAALRAGIESEVLPAAQSSYSEAAALVRRGERDTVLLLDTLDRLRDARSRLTDARRDESLAAADIEELLGPPERPEPEGDRP